MSTDIRKYLERITCMDKYRRLRENLRASFSLKLFGSFIMSISIVLIIFSPFFAYYQSRDIKEKLVNEGKMLSDLLAYNTRTWVFAENREMLKDIVRGIMNQKKVLAVHIFTSDSRVLIAEQKKDLDRRSGKASAVGGMDILMKLRKNAVPEVIEDVYTMDFVSPVVLESSPSSEEALYFADKAKEGKQIVIGYVDVVMDKNVLKQEIKSVFLRNSLIALAFMLAGIAIIYVWIRRVTRPLTSLTEAVKSLGMGESVENVSVELPDEIGRLAMSFNTMSENLRRREEEKKILEEKLRHAQKMEAVGSLARGIAHDFNNILSTVEGSLYILEKKLNEDSSLRDYTGKIHSSIRKAKNLIQGLLTFSRLQKIRPNALDINKVIRKLAPMLVNLAGEKVEVRIRQSEGALMVMADALQMEQVLMNLCTNSRDAMPDGGTLTIETETVTIDNDEALIRQLTSTGRYGLIKVADTGLGISDAIKERIFEPFFTTKEVGKGTGLGLSIVYGIIEQHKGHINLDAKKGEGTVFNIYLPLIEK